MEKRVFLAIFLSFGVLALYQAYLAPPPPAPVPPPAAAVDGTAPAGSAAPGTTPAPGTATPAGTPAAPATTAGIDVPPPSPAAEPLIADTEARDIVVETNAVLAVFSSQGATLKSYRLKHYADQHGEPLELVPVDIPAALPRPFTMATDDATMSATLRDALFQPNTTGLNLEDAPGTLSFQYSDASGLSARKTFHFQPDGHPYLINIETSVDVNGAARPVTLEWGPALSLGYLLDGSREIEARALLFRDGGVERIWAADLLELPRYSGAMQLTGVEEHYFMTVALPGDQIVDVSYSPITLPIPGDPEGRTRKFVGYSLSMPAGARTMPFYMGPKDFDVLFELDPKFVRAIDFGVFAWLVVPLLQALKWLNGYIGNYGFSIVALTVIINLLIFPLRHRSMVSMKKMQAVQPEVKAIQKRYEKYKITDPERGKMNQEMMALYKQKGVNPASGCVPMLLTMPILFAFYAMLQVAIEVRGAPFFGWIHDLSVHDPYYIWPVLMGGTMFWQQRLTPTTADPVQAKVFMFMPIMFTFMFLWFPAGLVIYWLTSNLMAVGQQYVTNGMMSKAVPAKFEVTETGKRGKG